MHILQSDSFDPAYNLALEEYLFTLMTRKRLGPTAMLWRNRPSIIVGRYQNTYQEINQEFVARHDLPVIRRLSGGGAVYHDLGTLNYSLLRPDTEELDFTSLTLPLREVLAAWDLPLRISGRNDLLLHGAKVCGCAQYKRHAGSLRHICILVNSDLEALAQALQADPAKYQSKGVPSLRSRVTNLSMHSSKPLTAELLEQALARHLNLPSWNLSPQDQAETEKLREQKYAGRDWNYGTSPVFTEKKERRFAWGLLQVFWKVQNGLLQAGTFQGDFLAGEKDPQELIDLLLNQPYQRKVWRLILEKIDWPEYFWGCRQESPLEFLLPPL